MEKIKDSFFKVKQDINTLNHNINSIKDGLGNTRKELIELCDVMGIISSKNIRIDEDNNIIKNRMSEIMSKLDKILERDNDIKLDNKLDNQTNTATQKGIIETNYFDFKTIRHNIKPLNGQISPISIGNGGGQTNRQTDKQTNRQQVNSSYNQDELVFKEIISSQKKNIDSIEDAGNILNSLDSIKKEIRLKFKRLTNQEILVFSTIYQLEEEFGSADYKSISKKINLTESSIRDYVRRLIVKGIPINKEKINNKEIKISVSQNLKKIATLSSILELRDL